MSRTQDPRASVLSLPPEIRGSVPESDAEMELALEMTVGGDGVAVDIGMDMLMSMLVFPVE